MKPHLPLGLRKALLAAVIAVSAAAYNQTYAAEAMGDLENMNGVTKEVSSITSADTNATLSNTKLTTAGDTATNDTGDVQIGTPEAENMAETDTLKLTQSTIASAADMHIDQNVELNASGLSSVGDLTVTGSVSGTNATFSSTGGDISLGLSNAKELTNVTIDTTNGGTRTGEGGDITIGGTEIDLKHEEPLKINGNASILAQGNITFNQNVEIDESGKSTQPAGTIIIKADDTITFNASKAKLLGVEVESVNGIYFNCGFTINNIDSYTEQNTDYGISLSESTSLKTTGDNADIIIHSSSEHKNRNELHGTVYEATGRIEISGNVNYLGGADTRLKLLADKGISFTSYAYKTGDTLVAGNNLYNIEASTNTGDIDVIVVKGQNAPNTLLNTTLSTEDGNINVVGGHKGYIAGSTVIAKSTDTEKGNVMFQSKLLDFYKVSTDTTIIATGNISAEAQTFNSSKNTSFTTTGTDKNIELIASNLGDSSVTPSLDFTDTTATNIEGGVTIKSEGGTAKLSNVKITAEDATVAGTTANITGGFISASNVATLNTDGTATLSGTKVNAKNVVLEGNDFIVKDGTTIGQIETGASTGTITAKSVTTGTSTIDRLTLEATGASAQNSIVAEDINIAANEAVTMKEGSLMQATDGNVLINGGATATNTINAAMVQAADTAPGESTDGTVNLVGAANQLQNQAQLQASNGISVTSSGTADTDGNLIDASTVNTTAGDVTITAANSNKIQNAAQVSTGDGDISLTGKTNELTASDMAAAGGNVKMTAAIANKLDSSTVTAEQDVILEATNNASELVNTISNALVEAGNNISITGKSNDISDNSGDDKGIMARGNISITSTGADDTSRNDISGTVVTAELGDVQISANHRNVIQLGAQITAEAGDISLTAKETNLVKGHDSKLVAEEGIVSLTGATNIVNEKSAIQAGTGIVINSTGTSATTGDGNLIAGSQLQTTAGDIDIDAARANVISGSATLEATAGNITIDGLLNIATDTALKAGQNIEITSTGDTPGHINAVHNTLVEAGADVAMSGKSNQITDCTGTDKGIHAQGGITLTSIGTTKNTNEASGDGNSVRNSSLVAETGDIHMEAKVTNELLSGSEVKAEDGSVSLTGANNLIATQSSVQAKGDIALTSTGTDAGSANLVTASSLTATGGNVTLESANINLVNDSNVTASEGASDETGAIKITGATNMVTAETTLQADTGISINSTGTSSTSGNDITDSTISTQEGGIAIKAEHSNIVQAGAQVTAASGNIDLTAKQWNIVTNADSLVEAENGAITLTGTSNMLTDQATIQGSGTITLLSIGQKGVTLGANNELQAGDGNRVDNATLTSTGNDVAMIAGYTNEVLNGSSVNATQGTISMEGRINIIAGDSVLTAKNDVTITATGEAAGMGNMVQGATVSTTNGDIALKNWNYLLAATLTSGNDISITTGEGEHQRSIIQNSELEAASMVRIAGKTTDRSEANLAIIHGSDTQVEASGKDETGTGILLNNVRILETGEQQRNILAKNGGNIQLQNRVDMQDAALTLDNATTSDARIVLNDGDVLNMKEKSRLQGRLTGDGVITKSGGDTLLLDYDHTEFNGSILVNGLADNSVSGSVADGSNTGSSVEINSTNVSEGQIAGVGAEAVIYMKNTDLIVNTGNAQIGTLDTTQDSGDAEWSNNPATGDTLLADGSYTQDDNKRTDFRTIGSVLEVQTGTVGDVVNATDMRLSDATLLKLDAAVNADGSVSSDVIEASGSIHAAVTTGLNRTTPAAAPSTARVYVALEDAAAAANAEEGARATIIKGKMVSDINADVLYEMELKNGTYQRKLQERNMHLENTGNGVDVVFSKNFRSCDKTDQMQQIADALLQAADAVDHTEGTLAAGSSEMHRILDAFDYTRSEEAARQGLLSLIGNGNLLPQLMLFDSSRHHINNLRRHIRMPECTPSHKGGKMTKDSVWLAYTGGFDRLDGDENMGNYKRTAHGAILGYDHTLNCKWRMGIALGFETSTGSADDSEVDGEAFFVDAYASMKSRRFKHRASVGLAFSSFESSRNIHIDAGYHSYSGSADSEMDALTLNLGYEISADYQLGNGAKLTPYAAINLAWHNQDAMKEKALGNTGVTTEFDSEWQLDVAAGITYSREFAARRNAGPAHFYANAAIHAELLNEQVSASSRFSELGGEWEMESMKRNPLYLELGAGVAVPLNHSWTATASGALEIGTERSSININAGVHYSF